MRRWTVVLRDNFPRAGFERTLVLYVSKREECAAVVEGFAGRCLFNGPLGEWRIHAVHARYSGRNPPSARPRLVVAKVMTRSRNRCRHMNWQRAD